MDPLSITTSAFALLDVVSKTASALRKYIKSVKNVAEAQKNLLAYLRGLSEVLNKIHFEAEDDDNAFEYLSEDLESCKITVQTDSRLAGRYFYS